MGGNKLPGLYRKTDTGIWYYQPPQLRGVRPRPISLKTKDYTAARERYFEKTGGARRGRSVMRGSAAVELYLAAKLKDRKHTAMSNRNAKTILGLFLEFAGNNDVALYRAADIERWRDSLQAGKRTAATERTYLRAAATWFKWLVDQEILGESPMANLHIPKGRKTRAERYCTQAERDFLLEASLKNAELAYLVWTGFFTGMRLTEMLEARPEWFDLSAKLVHVQETATFVPKDKEARAIQFGNRYRDFIEGYGMPSPFMLRPWKAHGRWRHRVETKAWLAGLRHECGMEWVTWHTLRHTFATLHILADTPLALVAKWLGDDYQTTYDNYFGYIKSHGYQDATD